MSSFLAIFMTKSVFKNYLHFTTAQYQYDCIWHEVSFCNWESSHPGDRHKNVTGLNRLIIYMYHAVFLC